MILISIILIIIGIILSIIRSSGYSGMIFCGLIPLLAMICILTFNKGLLSKIIYSENGIIWKRFKKNIMFISWEEITEIKNTPISMYSSYLSFISNNKQIDVELTKKMYDAIMFICPPNIKLQINDLEAFKCFHRNKNK